jgi:hypothetical protein
MTTTIIEFWGGLHDGNRRAIKTDRTGLPATIKLDESMPIKPPENAEAATPLLLRRLRYTYTLDRKSKRNLYRYTSCEEVKP